MLKSKILKQQKQVVLNREAVRQVLGDQGVHLPEDFIIVGLDGEGRTICDAIEIIYDEECK